MKQVAVIDADLVGRKKHRFPNLVCMKISGYHKELGNKVELKTDYDGLDSFDQVYLAKVFTDTEIPKQLLSLPNLKYGGTGFFYDKAPALPPEIEHHLPDYHLYDDWVSTEINRGQRAAQFSYYQDYSIGYLTRGCFRRCPFCVNQNYRRVMKHSPLKEFFDPTRKKICLLDDNFLGFPGWEALLDELQQTGRRFQFRQGLDERLLNDRVCSKLFSSKYDGDYIMAFDNLKDAPIIRRNMEIARKYTDKVIKFYVLSGFDYTGNWDANFWEKDIFSLMERIKILMELRCLPYIMRFAKYKESPYAGFYTTVARWCNQPRFYKKLSLMEFAELNGKNSAAYRHIMEFRRAYPSIEEYLNLNFAK